MSILITGGNGQLGRELKRKLSHSYSVWSLGKNELNITQQEAVESVISRYKPKVIIHTAAFTAVDECEINRKKAFEVNGIGTGFVTQTAKEINARIIYISSDYVFDGKKQTPYKEDDEPNPQSIYGMSKWLGERFVLSYGNGTVIRTSWLFGHYGKNFVKTMLKLAEKNREIKVVDDQFGSPTYVNDLAETIIQLLDKENGIYHVSNTGSCTWYEFARTIFEKAGFDSTLVLPITTEEYNSSAPRPKYSVLEHHALQRNHVKPLRPWDEAIKEFLQKETVDD